MRLGGLIRLHLGGNNGKVEVSYELTTQGWNRKSETLRLGNNLYRQVQQVMLANKHKEVPMAQL